MGKVLVCNVVGVGKCVVEDDTIVCKLDEVPAILAERDALREEVESLEGDALVVPC